MSLNTQNEDAVAPAQKPIFVTVHAQHWQCANGFEALGWRENHVVAGVWPFGPRGGRAMSWLSGWNVTGRFSKQEEAIKWAREYASARGFHYVESDGEARAILKGKGMAAPRWPTPREEAQQFADDMARIKQARGAPLRAQQL